MNRPVLVLILCGLVVSTTYAVPISFNRTVTNVDWTSAGCSGAGGGTCTITIAGVGGPVSAAYLYWHGIDVSSSGAVYDNAVVTINGAPALGTALGDATTNCWGDGSSRAFEANVTAQVAGNGAYVISNLSAGFGHNGNGASLVVIYNDGDNTNNRDLVFFTGNDSNLTAGFPGEDDGWHASLPGINYGGGPVAAQLHAADGQTFVDNTLTFNAGAVHVIADAVGLWEGTSLPSAGTSRAPNGELWDIHTFDITPAFTAPGVATLNVDGQEPVSDCLGLVLLLLDLEPFSAPGGCPDDLDPASQGYWHHQCLAMPADDPDCPGIDPGRNGHGPSEPNEPGFCPDKHDCAAMRLEDLGFFGELTCDGLNAEPPNNQCEKALKQLTASILNVCSERIGDGCEVDLSAAGCAATSVGEAIQEIADLINAEQCETAKSCAAAINEGTAYPTDGNSEPAPAGGVAGGIQQKDGEIGALERRGGRQER